MLIDEAKNKMCPYVFMSYFMPGNIRGETPCNSRCQANECMAWRWNYEAMVIGETISGTKILASGKGRISETDGYCGLIGKEGRSDG